MVTLIWERCSAKLTTSKVTSTCRFKEYFGSVSIISVRLAKCWECDLRHKWHGWKVDKVSKCCDPNVTNWRGGLKSQSQFCVLITKEPDALPWWWPWWCPWCPVLSWIKSALFSLLQTFYVLCWVIAPSHFESFKAKALLRST